MLACMQQPDDKLSHTHTHIVSTVTRQAIMMIANANDTVQQKALEHGFVSA